MFVLCESRFVSPSASERIRQKLYCLVIGLKEQLLWCTSEEAKVNDMWWLCFEDVVAIWTRTKAGVAKWGKIPTGFKIEKSLSSRGAPVASCQWPLFWNYTQIRLLTAVVYLSWWRGQIQLCSHCCVFSLYFHFWVNISHFYIGIIREVEILKFTLNWDIRMSWERILVSPG